MSTSPDFKEFEDDYDPKVEADTVGKAFGDYKVPKSKSKSKRKTTTELTKEAFEDKYEPDVDVNDPLASAFGDGFRTTKPTEVVV